MTLTLIVSRTLQISCCHFQIDQHQDWHSSVELKIIIKSSTKHRHCEMSPTTLFNNNYSIFKHWTKDLENKIRYKKGKFSFCYFEKRSTLNQAQHHTKHGNTLNEPRWGHKNWPSADRETYSISPTLHFIYLCVCFTLSCLWYCVIIVLLLTLFIY